MASPASVRGLTDRAKVDRELLIHPDLHGSVDRLWDADGTEYLDATGGLCERLPERARDAGDLLLRELEPLRQLPAVGGIRAPIEFGPDKGVDDAQIEEARP